MEVGFVQAVTVCRIDHPHALVQRVDDQVLSLQRIRTSLGGQFQRAQAQTQADVVKYVHAGFRTGVQVKRRSVLQLRIVVRRCKSDLLVFLPDRTRRSGQLDKCRNVHCPVIPVTQQCLRTLT